jgi:hypothetical protein
MSKMLLLRKYGVLSTLFCMGVAESRSEARLYIPKVKVSRSERKL